MQQAWLEELVKAISADRINSRDLRWLLDQPFLDQPFLDQVMVEEAVLVLCQSYT